MANFPEEAIWQDVYEIDNDDLVLGRKNSNTLGASNIPLQQLVNRDAYLKRRDTEETSYTTVGRYESRLLS